MKQLEEGEALYVPQLGVVAQRMRAVQREADEAGCARASAAGKQGVVVVEAVEDDPLAALLNDDGSTAPIDDFRAELAQRQGSVERETTPAGSDEHVHTAAKGKAVALLQKLDTVAVDGAQVMKQQQHVASVMLQEASLATWFRAKLPPVTRAAGNGGGRRPEPARGGGRQDVAGGKGAVPSGGGRGGYYDVDDYDDYAGAPGKGAGGRGKGGARSPPRAAAAAASAAVGRKGGTGGGESAGGKQRAARSEAEYPVPCFEAGCDFRRKTPGGRALLF